MNSWDGAAFDRWLTTDPENQSTHRGFLITCSECGQSTFHLYRIEGWMRFECVNCEHMADWDGEGIEELDS